MEVSPRVPCVAFDRLWVWDDPALATSPRWYREVAANRRPAKFRIAATIPVAVELAPATEAALWGELDRLAPACLERWQRVRAGAGRRGRRRK